VLLIVGALGHLAAAAGPAEMGAEAKAALARIGVPKGIVALIGMPGPEERKALASLAVGSDLVFYFQSPTAEDVAAVRDESEQAGLLGSRTFVDQGDFRSIHLADNLADAVWVAAAARDALPKSEILRVLRPGGKAILGEAELVKPQPEGTDCWSHPYHGPDNNPLSTDQLARAPYLTQFLAEPLFVPMPEISVAAGGRVFRAFGHIAHKANQNAMLNKLICTSAYNGTILWQRDLSGRFMIHRNTMIATPDLLYMADDESCKLIDAATGRIKDEIVVPDGVSDGPVWKWMALADGVLYALVGGEEVPIATVPSETPGLGHWPWGMWAGHEYKDPKTSFGFGRTLLAIDPATKRVLWSHKEDEYLDSRGVCMYGGRIYAYSPEKFLACFDAKTGDVVWKTSDRELLAAIGRNGPAQHYVTGYATTTYIKSNDKHLFFAGPQRSQLVVVSADDGKLVWHKEPGNYQLVLLDDVFYAAGPGDSGGKLAYETGDLLAALPQRRACTRATGSVDSVFYRTPGGTVRIETATDAARHIAPMRPPCQDGVLISDGHLYWGPWMCGCQLSLYGHIALGPAGDFDFHPALDESRLDAAEDAAGPLEPLVVAPGDWPTYRGDNGRSGATETAIPERVSEAWSFELPAGAFPTAPIAAGGLVFFGDRSGAVYALDAEDGSLRWKFRTAGPVYFPPAVADGRLLVGSADGRVYALEAATGRRLWTFRAAPAERWIPVYGKLISTWPVAGGVVVQDGTVYAAAGIAHYDGTYVYALDAATGRPKWTNDTSGATSQAVQSGASLQGELSIRGGRLGFLGGGVHETATYDLDTGECLNRPNDQAVSTFQTSFYAYFPEYGRYVSIDQRLADGRSLRYDVTYEGSRQSNLALLGPLPPGVVEPPVTESRWPGRRGGPNRNVLWQLPGPWLNGFVVSPDVLLAAGRAATDGGQQPTLAAINLADGKTLWRQTLAGPAVKAGTALDGQGRILVSLETGRVVCFRPGE
jgi:outer membrane protein assembly factor BamB